MQWSFTEHKSDVKASHNCQMSRDLCNPSTSSQTYLKLHLVTGGGHTQHAFHVADFVTTALLVLMIMVRAVWSFELVKNLYQT